MNADSYAVFYNNNNNNNNAFNIAPNTNAASKRFKEDKNLNYILKSTILKTT